MKKIDTLIKDMEHVVSTGEGWTEEISEWVANDIAKSLNRQLLSDRSKRKGTLRLSNLGTPCERKLWYHINGTHDTEPLSANTLSKFIFGDITESYILGLVKASGHTLEGLQDTLVVEGIRGHRDCVIDGMLIDVKSASSFAFQKFKSGKLRENDDFGYISQLSSYLYGSRNDPLVTEKKKAGFLVFDKQFAHLALDIYDLSDELETKPETIEHKKGMVKGPIPPRGFKEVRQYPLKKGQVDDGKPVNMKLPTACSYCGDKAECWPEARKFLYSGGPQWLTKVVREPNGSVFEDKDWK